MNRSIVARSFRAVAAALTLLVASCGGAERPTSPSFAVLVDLSGTWLSVGQASRNEAILRAVGDGIVEAAQSPQFVRTTVRYHAIGDTTLYQPPFCLAVFEAKLLGGRHAQAPHFYSRKELNEYLSEACVLAALHAPDQHQTQVTAALVTAVRSMRDPVRRAADKQEQDDGPAAQAQAPKRIVVLSDLKEEPISQYNLAQEDFHGVDVLVVYRALPEDHNDANQVEARITRWRTALEQAGAHVYDVPDSGLTTASIAAFLEGQNVRQ